VGSAARLLGRQDPGRRADPARRPARLHAANFDRDWGTASVRLALLDGADPDDIVASWESGLTAYRAIRERYLLYA
jgi:hypothetical protein